MSQNQPEKTTGVPPSTVEGPVWTYEDDRTRIAIHRKWCKGCEICVAFCPQATLVMDGEKPVVSNLASCSRCMLCELRCPDFAIEVTDKGQVEHV